MLGFGVCRKPGRVGREKRKGRLVVLAVFGEIEVYSPDQIPRRVTALEEFLDDAINVIKEAVKTDEIKEFLLPILYP